MQLHSSFFGLQEFVAAGFPANPNPLDALLLNNLVSKILDPIRLAMGSAVKINDCYRTEARYQSMIDSKLYNPSPTSDHFWSQSIPCQNQDDVARFGSEFHFGVGAADLKFPGATMSIEDIFSKVRSLNLPLGQCILEMNGESKWIHVSNPKTLCFSPMLIQTVGIAKTMYMTSNDNGKTYQAAA